MCELQGAIHTWTRACTRWQTNKIKISLLHGVHDTQRRGSLFRTMAKKIIRDKVTNTPNTQTEKPASDTMQVVAQELGIDASRILDISEKEMTAKSDQICIFRKKLGLFICYNQKL